MKSALSERDRRFFALVARAAFANPFSAERESLDGAIGETSTDDPDVLARVSARLSARLADLAPHGKLPLARFDEQDREHLFAAVLFDVFHRFLPAIDALIAEEEHRASDARVRVTFAPELLGNLAARGIDASQAVRVLELFYQMRRAHLAVATRLVGGGPSMRKLREELWNSLFTRDVRRYERFLWSRMEDFSTLLVGETGTGKGQAAQALGRSGFVPFDDKRQVFSARFTELFVPIHLGEHPESLIESELFGHRKGAFTGAIENHDGVLARTQPHGTLFLDEIGEVTLPVQVKLLRVLQERTYTPVGAREPRRFSGRIVAATHRSLSTLREEGRLRDDFFYRLSTHTIALPSLRTRLAESPGELALLVRHLCSRIVGDSSPAIAEEVCQAIQRDLGAGYDFPGNVRELEQCARRVLLTGHCAPDQGTIASCAAPLDALLTQLDVSADELVSRYCSALHARCGSYVEVARVTGLDRRTVKKYVEGRRT
jgi:DNA-binding NtrC family response regulator